VGDFLYSRAFQLMTTVERLSIMRCFADMTNCLAEGEAQQLLNQHHPDMTEALYLDIIQAKTAKLFETAAQLGPLLTESPAAIETALATFGLKVGMAFQMVDDILDYAETAHHLGKNPLQDLQEGKVTLPLLYTYRHASPDLRRFIHNVIRSAEPNPEAVLAIQTAVQKSGALSYTYQLAQQTILQAVQALMLLPASDYKTALIALAQFAIKRSH
jgi:octaprenyl-diphosphate synthase